jgi:myosin-5
LTPFPSTKQLIADALAGLQTPRLKRLAEIVSQQAIAQQEKMDYDGPEDDENNPNGTNGMNGDGLMNGNGVGHEHDTIHEEIAA